MAISHQQAFNTPDTEKWLTDNLCALSKSLSKYTPDARTPQDISKKSIDVSGAYREIAWFFYLDTLQYTPPDAKENFINWESWRFENWIRNRVHREIGKFEGREYVEKVASRMKRILENQEKENSFNAEQTGSSIAFTDESEYYWDIKTAQKNWILTWIISSDLAHFGITLLNRCFSLLITIHELYSPRSSIPIAVLDIEQAKVLARIILTGLRWAVNTFLSLPEKNIGHQIFLKWLESLKKQAYIASNENIGHATVYRAIASMFGQATVGTLFEYSETWEKSIPQWYGLFWEYNGELWDTITFDNNSGWGATIRGKVGLIYDQWALQYATITGANIWSDVKLPQVATRQLLDSTLYRAQLYDCTSVGGGSLCGLVGSQITACFNTHGSSVYWYIPVHFQETTRFIMSNNNSVHIGQLGRASFEEESGKTSTFMLSWNNIFTATGTKTLSNTVIFIENPETFSLNLSEGAGEWLVIISPKPLEPGKVTSKDGTILPKILSPQVQGLNHVDNLKKISRNMYKRFPYIRAEYRSIFEQVQKDVLSLKTLATIALSKNSTPKIDEDLISVSIIFSRVSAIEQQKVIHLLEAILAEEAALDASEEDKKSWEDRTEKDYIAIEKAIQKRRLWILEQIMLRTRIISQEDLNRELRDFFNPFTLSSIERNPIWKVYYDSLTVNTRRQLQEYLIIVAQNTLNNSRYWVDWRIFIATFNFLRSMELNLPTLLFPSNLLFQNTIPSREIIS